jgi:amino-acid N-acetyltransferase
MAKNVAWKLGSSQNLIMLHLMQSFIFLICFLLSSSLLPHHPFIRSSRSNKDLIEKSSLTLFHAQLTSRQDMKIPIDISNLVISSETASTSLEKAMSNTSSSISADEMDPWNFGDIFRQCAPYIAMHRNSIVVIHISSHVFKHRIIFDSVIDDISILHLLGVNIVIVAGVRQQLDEKLHSAGVHPTYNNGIRISDSQTMQFLKEVSGSARFEIESSLARGYRGRPGQSGINVVSGNFFYSAKPYGVRDGVDYQLTGDVRKIEVDNIKKRLEFGDVVLLTSLGYSPSGEVFNCQSECLAAECAAGLNAAKIIYLTRGEVMYDITDGKQTTVQNLRLTQAMALVEKLSKTASGHNLEEYRLILERSVYALNSGVKRAHFITPMRGSLLKELYTRDGAGMLISRDVYEGIRPAQPSDLRAIEDLIAPLVSQGILVKRTRDQLEKELPNTYLLARDGTTLALGMIKAYGDYAEIGCLAVDPKYRKAGRGETMLAFLERQAVLKGISKVFVLSTHTMQWFEERGFEMSDPSLLPPARGYNTTRASKVYIKHLSSERDIDAEELLWNV